MWTLADAYGLEAKQREEIARLRELLEYQTPNGDNDNGKDRKDARRLQH